MAVLAEVMEDRQSFVMLVTIAMRQIELLALDASGASENYETESYQRLLAFARLLDYKTGEVLRYKGSL
jgi:hypothetical protein